MHITRRRNSRTESQWFEKLRLTEVAETVMLEEMLASWTERAAMPNAGQQGQLSLDILIMKAPLVLEDLFQFSACVRG